AFHEAFADIVALLQHFTFPEILRHQITRTRGEIRSQENLLGQLAGQFGRASGGRGALRDAIGRYNPETQAWEPRKPDPLEYERTTEPHARGAILVAAVFDAFLSIYETRVADLLRLATGGTGILAPGAIHPDLVRRLSEEAAKAAKHVLTMCIRALDYCPPVDLTFGEYLRALITADYDLVRDDDLKYRVAFVEAFRKRGLYPRDVRTLSVESLLWRGVHGDAAGPSQELLRGIINLRHHADALQYAKSRSTIFFLAREMRREVHEWLEEHFEGPCGRRDAGYLGLEYGKKFEVHAARLSNRVGPDGQKLLQFVIELLQERTVQVDPREQTKPVDPQEPVKTMKFEGGCTIVADLHDLEIKYCIRKHASSEQRLARQQAFVQQLGADSLRSTYFEEDTREPFAMLHRI
ncbi:MAG TPA: hypothetical protein VGQ11_06605, partial [Candidatus Acidoferrales bacterium]|nr:hypothetical protein [Candidatus Acidoferrales bacterium]